MNHFSILNILSILNLENNVVFNVQKNFVINMEMV